ncbi:FadR/GntR family transcriptional regulator [Pedobacter rhodius]|uniref:FadR/GntR family transcriptional regulator n=1 Tax=Pedobacter rhodius TaxID=3004098 RepID=A0ABT4L1P7_9SPHI|nr:FadR/GntR family transcriptional regulator [Pedobacter sp. SJ11]MCZ4225102.1 FadR/GntR family transcriptional regulator [Pedobacter sp. SJ11]
MTKIINRKSLAEEVAASLQEQIQDNTYKINEKLPIEPELMKIFGVGRSTLREALRILENSGTIMVRHGVGAFVTSQTSIAAPLSKQLMDASPSEVKEVREILELKIVEKAALNRTDSDIKSLKEFLKKRNNAADSGNFKEWVEADVNFHIAIAQASKNRVLTDLYKTFAEQQLKKSITATAEVPAVMNRFTFVHIELLESIINQQPESAKKLIAEMNKQL